MKFQSLYVLIGSLLIFSIPAQSHVAPKHFASAERITGAGVTLRLIGKSERKMILGDLLHKGDTVLTNGNSSRKSYT